MKTILAITATRSVLAHSNNTGVFAGMADAPEIVQVTVVAEPLWSIVNTPEFPDPKALESVISRLLPVAVAGSGVSTCASVASGRADPTMGK